MKATHTKNPSCKMQKGEIRRVPQNTRNNAIGYHICCPKCGFSSIALAGKDGMQTFHPPTQSKTNNKDTEKGNEKLTPSSGSTNCFFRMHRIDPVSIKKYLEGVGLPAKNPETKPARPPPQMDFEYDDYQTF